MQIKKTEELVKSLALHFVHNKIFNISILQLLCSQQKIHASTTSQQIQSKIKVIDKGFQLLRQNKKTKSAKQLSKNSYTDSLYENNLFHMLNIFIFNVSAINQYYINQMEKHMAESTASQSNNSMNSTFYKDKMGISILKQHLQYYFSTFIQNSKFLQGMIAQIHQIQTQNKRISECQLGLLQTLDYLCVKYSISNATSDKIIHILQKNEEVIVENTSQMFHIDSVKQTNKLLFSQKKQTQLFQMIESNSYINFKNVLSIVDANYLNQNPPRKIFNAADLSGKQAIQSLIAKILKRIGKNQLFSEKSQEYSPFRLLLYHFLNKHFSVYLQFNELIKELMTQKNPFSVESNLQILKQFQRYFRLFVTLQNPYFHQILRFIYCQLSAKYSESVSLQLIKKLLLNRFLLNPSLYMLYNEPNQNQIKKYVQIANYVRTLFYPNKIDSLVQKLGNPYLKKISSQVCYSFDYCLKKQKDQKSILQNSASLYINDKILKNQMQILYQQLKQNYQSPKQAGNVQNVAVDYSLSFSLVKNQQTRNNLASNPLLQNLSQVKFDLNTNRSNTNLKDNQSIRFMYDQLKGAKSQTEFPPYSPEKLKLNTKTQNKQEKRNIRTSQVQRNEQLSRKQHQVSHQTRLHTLHIPTDRQIIQELVQLRKQYGERKRTLRTNYQGRRNKRLKKISQLKAVSQNFNKYKNEIEKQNNILYINMTAIA